MPISISMFVSYVVRPMCYTLCCKTCPLPPYSGKLFLSIVYVSFCLKFSFLKVERGRKRFLFDFLLMFPLTINPCGGVLLFATAGLPAVGQFGPQAGTRIAMCKTGLAFYVLLPIMNQLASFLIYLTAIYPPYPSSNRHVIYHFHDAIMMQSWCN